jgi:ABC-type transport system involved in cytochrome bd biosynthesis fused ATPase/permease subunit
MGIQEGINGISTAVIDFVEAHPVGTAIGAGTAALGTGLVIAAVSRKKSKRKARKISHTRRGLRQDRKRISKQPWEQAYQRRKRKNRRKKMKKSRSKKGIHYTKNGQPYKLMSNGKARFIKRRKR